MVHTCNLSCKEAEVGENYHELEASTGYTVRSRPARDTQQDLV